MGVADLAAALGLARWRRQRQAEPGTGLNDALGEEPAERERFRAHRGKVRLEGEIDADFQRGEAEDGRCADDRRGDPRRRAVIRIEGEWCGVAEPAGEWRAELGLQPLGYVEEGRCPRPALEILVAAANGEIGIAG